MNRVILVPGVLASNADCLRIADMLSSRANIEPTVIWDGSPSEAAAADRSGKVEILPAYEGFDAFAHDHRSLSRDGLLDLQLEYAPLVGADLFRHDFRFLLGAEPEILTVLRQAFLCRFATRVLTDRPGSSIFLFGANDLLVDVFGQMAGAHAAKAYRVSGAEYLNSGSEGVRVRFSGADRFGYDPESAFEYDPGVLQAHIRNWIAGVRRQGGVMAPAAKQQAKIRKSLPAWIWRIWQAAGRKIPVARLADVPRPFVLFDFCSDLGGGVDIRAGQIRDQLSVCQQVANSLPEGVALAIRCAADEIAPPLAEAMGRFLAENGGRAILLADDAPRREALRLSRGLISVAGSLPLEAAALGVACMRVGPDAADWVGLAEPVERFDDLIAGIARLLADSGQSTRHENLEKMLTRLVVQSAPAPGINIEREDGGKALEMLAVACATLFERKAQRRVVA